VLAGFLLFIAAGPTSAQGSSSTTTDPVTREVTTPYTGLVVQPGSTVQIDIDVTSPEVEPVALTVDAPEGWRTTLRGGGFVVTGVTAGPDDPGKAKLEIAVPPDVESGAFDVTVTAAFGSTQRRLDVELTVQADVEPGITVTADFPSLQGTASDTFAYTLSVTNITPEEATFTFSPQGPQGWELDASPQAEQRANTVSIEAGGSADVKVTAKPAVTTDAGEYPIVVDVSTASGARGSIGLTAVVTGTPELAIATADGKLNASGGAGKTTSETILVANSGSAPLEGVHFAATPPSGWEVTFEPSSIGELAPGDTAQVVACIQPDTDAVAGDYAVGIRASSGSNSSTLDLRYSVETSSWVGVVAAMVIVAALAVLFGVYRLVGRR
jgi:uncharacterized membrane protein